MRRRKLLQVRHRPQGRVHPGFVCSVFGHERRSFMKDYRFRGNKRRFYFITHCSIFIAFFLRLAHFGDVSCLPKWYLFQSWRDTRIGSYVVLLKLNHFQNSPNFCWVSLHFLSFSLLFVWRVILIFKIKIELWMSPVQIALKGSFVEKLTKQFSPKAFQIFYEIFDFDLDFC